MDILQIIVFKIGTQSFGMQINDVVRIVYTDKVAKSVETRNPFVTGMISLNEQAVPVYDMHRKLQINYLRQSSMFVVISFQEKMMAFAVDEIDGYHKILQKDMSFIPAVVNLDRQCFHQVVILDNRLILMLDIHNIFMDINI